MELIKKAPGSDRGHVRSAFQEVARAWLLLAEQMEWMEGEEETRRSVLPCPQS